MKKEKISIILMVNIEKKLKKNEDKLQKLIPIGKKGVKVTIKEEGVMFNGNYDKLLEQDLI